MNYQEIKKHIWSQIREEIPGLTFDAVLYEFCIRLSATEFRWFKSDVSGKIVYLEIQDGGLRYKKAQYDHADQFKISIELISQREVYHAVPITQDEFNRVLKQAMGRLLKTSK